MWIEDLISHLFRDLVVWSSGDAGHEVAGDEGSDDDRPSAGRLLLERVTIKVQWGEDDWHLADLT